MIAERSSSWRRSSIRLLAVAGVVIAAALPVRAISFPEFTPGVAYADDVVARAPWVIHIVRVDLSHREFELQSAHAMNLALGLGTLSNQMSLANPAWGTPVAGVNGDFYQRDREYRGDTRGLQIVDGEIISAPADSASFWIDGARGLHTDKTESRFSAAFPGGRTVAFGLNQERAPDAAVLYTPAVGNSTLTKPGGMELVLERAGDGAWLPLKAGETYSARVREVRADGNTRLARNAMVLSLGATLASSVPAPKPGDVLKLSSAIAPDLRGARTAISGGPVLVRGGKKFDWKSGATPVGPTGMYSVRSMYERHPRTAIGWNEKHFFLVGVDGRNPSSEGMTLDEMTDYLIGLGCTEGMNLDGGGSATMYANGRLVTRPSDPGGERKIANSLLVMKKSAGQARVTNRPEEAR